MFSSLRKLNNFAKFPQRFYKSCPTAYYFSSLSRAKDIKVMFQEETYSFEFTFHSDEKKIFFLNNSFTFNSLRNMLTLEQPKCNIDISYPKSAQTPVDDDTPIVKYLLSSNPAGRVVIEIDDATFNLNNVASYETNNLVNKFLGEIHEDKTSVLNWYQQSVNNKIDLSHSNVISYLSASIIGGLSKFPKNNNMTERELDVLIAQAIENFSNPVNKRVEGLLEKKNELSSKIKYLQGKINQIEGKAEKRILLYKKLVVLVAIVQAISFYYMIFHVDWLGWDIIEPITYTCSQLTVLLTIRFFLKYGKTRSWDTIRRNFQQNVINRNKATRDQYSFFNRKLADRISELQKVESEMLVLRNRRSNDIFL